MKRISVSALACGMLAIWTQVTAAQDASTPPAKTQGGALKILVFGDTSPNNPPTQQALMERSIKQVGEVFKERSYEVDLIPTAQLSASVVKERLARYARTLTPGDTFVLYSHSHGGPRGTFFANWSEFANDILALPARNVIVFAMSCHSGNLTDTLNAMKSKWEGRSKSGRSLVVLTPVSAAQNAGPSPERGVGNPFTYAVTTAMQGGADGILESGKNGSVEMKELVDYVLKVTHEKSRDMSHSPQFAGEFPAGAVFVAVPDQPPFPRPPVRPNGSSKGIPPKANP